MANGAVGNMLRRGESYGEMPARREPALLRFGSFDLDRERRELRRDGVAVPIQTKPFTLLVYLLENADRAVPHEEILRVVWRDVCVEPGAMKSAIHALRRALGCPDRGPGGESGFCIKTVHGHGYRFVGPVQSVERGAPAVASAPDPWRCPQRA